LIAADPLGVAQAWEQTARALEGIGAAVELERAGLAYFEADGLRGVYGGERETIAAAREAARSPSGRIARVGAGPTRFCALAAALAARSRRVTVVDEREAGRYLAAQPVSLLGFRAETAVLVEGLSRLGVRTLGELTALGRDAVADRFGAAGVLAHRLAAGEEEPLCTRRVKDGLEEEMELWEAGSGAALERVLGVLVERLLARVERRGRTLGAVTLSAVLVESGGTWSELVVFRQASADAKRICMALSLRLALLPAPAQTLRLAVERFGPPGGAQRALLEEDVEARHERLCEAVGQMRVLAGRDAALRALCVDPDSRVPERRVVLSPFTA
jgi:protein ImuB